MSVRTVRRLVALLVACLTVSATAPLLAQSNAPRFDVVSVKRSGPPATSTFRLGFYPDMFVFPGGPVYILIGMAHPDIQLDEIINIPEWARTDSYEVLGRLAPGLPMPSPEQQAAMLRTVLSERFQFRGHTEQRQTVAYDLVITKGGIVTTGLRRPTDDAQPCGLSFKGGKFVSPGRFEGELTMSWLTTLLRRSLGRPVVDKTGLSGSFCATLQASGFGSKAGRLLPRAQDDSPSIFTALQEQLGLKLVNSQEPIDVLVIDHIERPSPN
jgi:uncharacterized protein (TIGR03435 family)